MMSEANGAQGEWVLRYGEGSRIPQRWWRRPDGKVTGKDVARVRLETPRSSLHAYAQAVQRTPRAGRTDVERGGGAGRRPLTARMSDERVGEIATGTARPSPPRHAEKRDRREEVRPVIERPRPPASARNDSIRPRQSIARQGQENQPKSARGASSSSCKLRAMRAVRETRETEHARRRNLWLAWASKAEWNVAKNVYPGETVEWIKGLSHI